MATFYFGDGQTIKSGAWQTTGNWFSGVYFTETTPTSITTPPAPYNTLPVLGRDNVVLIANVTGVPTGFNFVPTATSLTTGTTGFWTGNIIITEYFGIGGFTTGTWPGNIITTGLSLNISGYGLNYASSTKYGIIYNGNFSGNIILATNTYITNIQSQILGGNYFGNVYINCGLISGGIFSGNVYSNNLFYYNTNQFLNLQSNINKGTFYNIVDLTSGGIINSGIFYGFIKTSNQVLIGATNNANYSPITGFKVPNSGFYNNINIQYSALAFNFNYAQIYGGMYYPTITLVAILNSGQYTLSGLGWSSGQLYDPGFAAAGGIYQPILNISGISAGNSNNIDILGAGLF